MTTRAWPLAALVLLSTACSAEKPETAPAGSSPGSEPEVVLRPAERDYMRHYRVDGSFDEVWEFVKFAVTERGIKINNISHIGEMLRRTGEDVGATEEVFVKAKVVEFCSATVSRQMMEADPHNIVFCPYIISVYELTDEPGVVNLAFRRPALVGNADSRAALGEVEKLLENIIAEAVGN
jgi:uncharacterized protein (DUF302 family)